MPDNKTAPRKPKLVRDSFTIPKTEYAAIEALKTRAIAMGTSVKKSELLRAGLMALVAMSDAGFKAAVAAVPTLKPGRPQAEAESTAPKKTAAAKAPAKAPAKKVAGPKTTASKAPVKKAPAKKASVRKIAAAKPVARKAAARPAVKAAPASAQPGSPSDAPRRVRGAEATTPLPS